MLRSEHLTRVLQVKIFSVSFFWHKKHVIIKKKTTLNESVTSSTYNATNQVIASSTGETPTCGELLGLYRNIKILANKQLFFSLVCCLYTIVNNWDAKISNILQLKRLHIIGHIMNGILQTLILISFTCTDVFL